MPLDQLLEEAERRLILLALRLARGKHTRAAELLEILRQRLWRRMKEFAGRIAVLTGGGSGMGRELVVQLAAPLPVQEIIPVLRKRVQLNRGRVQAAPQLRLPQLHQPLHHLHSPHSKKEGKRTGILSHPSEIEL